MIIFFLRVNSQPLCKEPFESIKILATQAIEKLEPPKKTVDNSTPDLECLDDKYFLGIHE